MMGEGLAPEPGARASAPTLLNAQQDLGDAAKTPSGEPVR